MDTLKMYPLTIAEVDRNNRNIVDQLIGFDLVNKGKANTTKNTLKTPPEPLTGIQIESGGFYMRLSFKRHGCLIL